MWTVAAARAKPVPHLLLLLLLVLAPGINGLPEVPCSSCREAKLAGRLLGAASDSKGTSGQTNDVSSLVQLQSQHGSVASGRADSSLRTLTASDSTLAADAAHSNSSTTAIKNDTLSERKTQQNDVFNQHFASNGGGWASGVQYTVINSSVDVPLQSSVGQPSDIPRESTEPPPYKYPPVLLHPTVYFTAVLSSLDTFYGLTQDEQIQQVQAALSAAINSFITPTPGLVMTSTSMLAKGSADGGLWLPCATVFYQQGSSVLQQYLADILRSDPNLILPTGKWGNIRVKNVDVVQPIAPASIVYRWELGEYSACSEICGGGTQTRAKACKDNFNNPAEFILCPRPEPPSSRPCQMQPCQASLPVNFAVRMGDWSPCNATCGYGLHTRTVTCVSDQGFMGALSDCKITTADLLQNADYRLWEPCPDQPPCPTFHWAYDDWVCTTPEGCGTGVASRPARCVLSSTGQAVNTSMCDPDQMQSNVTKPCELEPCLLYYWKARELADCQPEDPSNLCGRYVQRRNFDCVNMTSAEVVNNIFCNKARPQIGEVECSRPAEVDCSSGSSAQDAPDATSASTPTSSDVQQQSAAGDSSETIAGGASSDGSSGGATDAMPAAAAGSGSVGSTSSSTTGDVASTDSAPPADSNEQVADVGVGAQTEGAQSGKDSTTVISSTGDAGTTATITASEAASSSSSSSGTSGANLDGSSPVLPFDIGPGSGSSGAAPASGTFGAEGSTPASSQLGTGGGSTGGVISTMDLGADAQVPTWLLNNPTSALKAVLDCTGGYAVSSDGQCCQSNLIDKDGACCEEGKVDACGKCNGDGIAVDALGFCCESTVDSPAMLDAQGICCRGFIDECGVCNGNNACELKVELIVYVGGNSANSFLGPATRGNMQLKSVLQSDIAAAIGSTTGRAFEKSRVWVLLSAYNPPPPEPKLQPAEGVMTVSEWEGAGQGSTNSSPGTGGLPDGQAVAALPRLGADSFTGSLPGQTAMSKMAPEQVDAPAAHANLASQRPASAHRSAEALQLFEARLKAAEAAEGLDTPLGSQAAQQGMAVSTSLNSTDKFAAEDALWDMEPHTDQKVPALQEGQHSKEHLRSLAQANQEAIDFTDLNSTNAVRVSVILKAPSGGSGAELGSVLLTFNNLPGKEVPITGHKKSLTYMEIVYVGRAGNCGDGICQANERVSADARESCPADCALPFVPCPPFSSDAAPCNGLGVCHTAIGACICTRGYIGDDCSICAAGYKRINGYCIASRAIAPPRTAGESMLTNVPPQQDSWTAGAALLVSLVLPFMAFIGLCAFAMYKLRQKLLWNSIAKEIAEQAAKPEAMS